MSLLDRVHACTRHDPGGRVPLRVEGAVRGRLTPALAEALTGFPDVFVPAGDGLALHPDLHTAALRTQAVGAVVDALYPRGLFGARRGELYPVSRRFDDAPAFALERGAVGAFGTPAFGVHLNGFVDGAAGPRLWIARRAAAKPTFPGRLDHLVGGGQPLGLGVEANLRKECAEEAGLPDTLLGGLTPIHRLTYRFEDEYGFHDDTTFVFDLALPSDFRPRPQDGEVDAFELWPLARVIDTLRTTRAFKTNVALVILDWLLRRGELDGDPERDALEDAIGALRGPLGAA
ncbi:MAG: DUF4743 domain-containing protein [Planctomycetota bacterium]|nr:DUF4743 domain-containing protein [Planctomycetota bacterium]